MTGLNSSGEGTVDVGVRVGAGENLRVAVG